MDPGGSNQEQYIDNAIRAVRDKKQVPEIDFTIHEMEDGVQVNTQERVCKGMTSHVISRTGRATQTYWQSKMLTATCDRRPGARLQHPDRRADHLASRPIEAQPSVPQAALVQRRPSHGRASTMDHQLGRGGAPTRA